MIYVLCNVVTGALLSISEQPISTEGHPLQVKTFDMPMPDLTKVEWDYGGLNFKSKPGDRKVDKIDWRRLFTASERPLIDEFNATFETIPYLTNEQKRDIRSGLEDYKATPVVNKDDPDTSKMLALYEALGYLAPGRAAEILA